MAGHGNYDTDPKTFQDVRDGIPVTKQRRFDVYRDINE
jgi:omega-amidase